MHKPGLYKHFLPKKWLCLFCSLFLLTTCTSPKEESQYVIGFSQCTAGDDWRKAMHEEMRRELAFYPGISLKIKDAQNNTSKQIQHIKTFIKEGVDVLIVSPNEAAPITPVIEKAFNEGLPVIILDRRTTSNAYTAYLGANNYEIGQIAGKYIASLLKGKGQITEIWGLPGSSPAQDRHQGFTDALKDYPEIKLNPRIEGNWLKDTAQHKLSVQSELFKQSDLVFAHNDVMALGAYEEFKKNGQERQVRFVGIDALAGPRGGIQMVHDHILDATFLYPTGGEEAIQLAVDILENAPFEKENILQSTVVDSTNVRVMKMQTSRILSQQADIERQENRIQEQIRIYQNQKALLYFLSASLALSLILGIATLLSLRAKQRINRRLGEKNQQIVQQGNEIEAMATQVREATEAKVKFFTNISHEFRTLLNLILDPVEDLLALAGDRGNRDLILVRRNTLRLLRLVNQLMDFRKIENHKMKLQASETELIRFVQDIREAFQRTALKRNIDYRFYHPQAPLLVWIDEDKLDKVLFNLLSNAFKFTKDGGFIHIRIQTDQNAGTLCLEIEDNGRGMSPEHVAHAFDRFYQGEYYRTIGTGLGLSLSKELIKLHHGQITVKSQKGLGTTFQIRLQLGQGHLRPEEMLTQDPQTKPEPDKLLVRSQMEELLESTKTNSAVPSSDTSVLVIEDNADMRNYLRHKLSEFYQVQVAEDGLEGKTVALEHIPDLIICDLRMPHKDGITLIKEFKSDLRTSHIPIIIISAEESIEKHIQGAQVGADAYLTKPVNFNYLQELVQSIFRNREILRSRYTLQLDLEDKPQNLNSVDKKFMNHFVSIIEENVANSSFQVDTLCHEIGLSRVQLYRKVKALFGCTVNDYIKDVRLKKARQLLCENELPIAEIAYEVGFNSPAYFSTAFKARFELTPKEFKEQHSPSGK